MERVDGLAGPLIVRPAGEDPLAKLYDEEKIIGLTDWYHDLYGPLTFATSRCGLLTKVLASEKRCQKRPECLHATFEQAA